MAARNGCIQEKVIFMARQYRTREGEATAVDTKTQLTTLGSETAPGALLVPAGKTKLAGIIASACSNYAATGSFSAFVRLEGGGLPEGPETVAIAAGGVTIATGGQDVMSAAWYPLDIPVTPANEILVFGEMAGADVGQVSFGVTLVFE
jgi:hypothetical protein